MTWRPPEQDRAAAEGWKPPEADRPPMVGAQPKLGEGITPENPGETVANLLQAAGTYLKSKGLNADKERFGAKPYESAGGVAGATGSMVEGAGKGLEMLLPKTPGDVAGMVAADVGMGAAAKGYNKFIAASPELRAATDKAVSTAKSMGYKLLPSQQTQSYLAGLFENVMRKLPGGASVFQKYEAMQQQGFLEAKKKILDGLGRESQMDFGGSLKEALGKANDAITATANDLLKKGQINKEAYDIALKRHEQRLAKLASAALKDERGFAAARIGGASTEEGRGLVVQLERAHQAGLDYLKGIRLWEKAISGVPRSVVSTGENVTKASERIVEKLESAGIKNDVYAAAKRNLQSTEDAEVEGILTAAREQGLEVPEAGQKTSYNLEALQDKQSFYGALAENHRNPVTGAYDLTGSMFRDLQKAVQADMDGVFKQVGGRAKQDYEIAKAFTKETSSMADLKIIRKLWDENPSAILDAVVKAGDKNGTATLIQALGRGETGKNQLRRHIFDRVFGAGDAPIPSRDKIMAGLAEYSENMKAIFTPDEIKQLRALGEKSEIPEFIQDRYDRRVKEILDTYKQRALMSRDPVLKKLARQEPQQLVQSVLQGDPGVVRAIRKYVSSEQFAAYQRYGMRDLLADPALPQQGTAFIKGELAKKPEFYKELLGEKNYADMQRIGEAELLLPGYKDLKHFGPDISSGQARLGMAATFGIMGIALRPFGSRTLGGVIGTGVGLTIAPQILSEMYLSDSGRRIVTTLLRLPQTDPRTDYLIAKLAAAGYVTAVNAQRPQERGQQGAPPR